MDELHEQESTFSHLVSRFADEQPDVPEHRAALRDRALAAFDVAGQRQIAPPIWKQPVSHGREIMRRPLARFALAAAVFLAIVALRWSLPGEPSAAQAFAMFAKALVDAQSAKFWLESTTEGQEKETLKSYYLAAGKMRSETEGFVQVIDMQAGKILDVYSPQKAADLITVKLLGGDVSKLGSMDIFEQLRTMLADSRAADEGNFTQLGGKVIDGQRVVGFRFTAPLQSATLWGDPATGMPVLVELTWNGILRSKTTMSRFEFNAELDPALFDLTPPAGYAVQTLDLDVSNPSEQGLIDSLRAVANWNDGRFVDGLDAASAQALIAKKAADDNAPGAINRRTMQFTVIGVGLEFALGLPESANSQYAGKGVRLGEPNRPIFWYQPVGSETYRVIFADLSVQDAPQPPQAAMRLLAAEQASTFQAFNVLAEALLEAKSATFEMQVNVQGKVNQKLQSSYLAPGKMRNEMKGMINFVSITDLPGNTFISLIPSQKLAFVMQMKNREARAGKPDLDDLFEQMRDLLEKSRDAKDDKFERLGEKEIDGRRAVGFSHATSMERLTLWGDPVTGLPIWVELLWPGDPRTEVTMSRFELNEKLDPKLFDTTPPAGYHVQKVEVDLSHPTEETFVMSLGRFAEWNDGQFPDSLNLTSAILLLSKRASVEKKENRNVVSSETIGQFMVATMSLEFVSELPESADAHYAGKGVKRDEPDRPIFWYKPKAAPYRVIYADLSVKDLEVAPQVAGAVRLKNLPPEQPKP